MPSQEPDDKVVSKVASMYGILEQLGFEDVTIEECLRSITRLELDDALEWVRLSLLCDPNSAILNCSSTVAIPPPAISRPRLQRTSGTDRRSARQHASLPCSRAGRSASRIKSSGGGYNQTG